MRSTVLMLSMLAVGLLALCVSLASASYWEDEMNRVRKAAADMYMARMAKLPNVTTLPSGILVTVLERGNGDVAPATDDACDVQYTSYFRFSGIFEDTRPEGHAVRRRPAEMIQGLQEAMRYMREGDRWYIYVPYTLAYGVDGNATVKVPSYTNLRYDLQIVKCDAPHGLQSAEIDAYLDKYLKQPMPPKNSPASRSYTRL